MVFGKRGRDSGYEALSSARSRAQIFWKADGDRARRRTTPRRRVQIGYRDWKLERLLEFLLEYMRERREDFREEEALFGDKTPCTRVRRRKEGSTARFLKSFETHKGLAWKEISERFDFKRKDAISGARRGAGARPARWVAGARRRLRTTGFGPV